MSDNMHMFERTIRHQQSVFIIEILPIARCAMKSLLHENTIFWMHALKDHIKSNGERLAVSKNSETFLRPWARISRRCALNLTTMLRPKATLEQPRQIGTLSLGQSRSQP